MSSKLNAFMVLLSTGVIDRATDARYLGCPGGDHIFGLSNGDLCRVDLVIGSVKSTAFATLYAGDA